MVAPDAARRPPPSKMFFRNATLDRASLMAHQIAALPDASARAVLAVDREDTDPASMDAFTRVVNGARLRASVEERLFMVRVQGIGLYIDGRHSLFDMHYFPATEVIAVVDQHDDRFVATLQTCSNEDIQKLVAAHPYSMQAIAKREEE